MEKVHACFLKGTIWVMGFISIFGVFMASCGDEEEEQTSTGIVSGIVSDYSDANSPIVGATVIINPKGLSMTTGSDGHYEFVGMEPGTYTLSVSANNFQPTSKRIEVYAGQTSACDFQLEKASVDVEIAPQNLVFERTMEQISFTITNKMNNPLNYSISNYPDYIQVSPVSGTVASKGKIVVGLTLINRSSITTARSGQLTINIGNDSYVVNISVEGYQEEKVNIDIAPSSLFFDSNTEQLSFTITNRNTFANSYVLSTNLDILMLSQEGGILQPQGQHTIAVTVKNRKELTYERNGQVLINAGGNTYIVSVHVDKYETEDNNEDNNEDPNTDPDDTDWTAYGMDAYYNFDNGTAEDKMGSYDAFLSGGTFITNTPNGKGKALQLKQGEYMTIGASPLGGEKSFSVSMWVKDFGKGVFIRSTTGNYYDLSPTWNIAGNGKITYNTYDRRYGTFGVSLSAYSSKWTMLTIVSDGSEDVHKLYVNGTLASSITSDGTMASRNCSLQVGGETWYSNGSYQGYENSILTSAMKVDNLRLYSRALDASDVKAIYNAERQ